jgi:hypothetical protein
MELNIKDISVKTISFESFEKYFFEALNPSTNNNIIFFKLLKDEIQLTFSWDNFIITTTKKYYDIIQMFPNAQNDAEVLLEDDTNLKTHSSITKFIQQYTHNRGIKEE